MFELYEQHEIGILVSSLIHEYMVTHTLWLVFYINKEKVQFTHKYINNDRNSNLKFCIDAR